MLLTTDCAYFLLSLIRVWLSVFVLMFEVVVEELREYEFMASVGPSGFSLRCFAVVCELKLWSSSLLYPGQFNNSAAHSQVSVATK